jgi:uncharacterized protein YgiM (DUF1202 family)
MLRPHRCEVGDSLRPITPFVFLTLMILSIAAAPIAAQADCPAAVQEALDAAANACTGLTRNTVCYGNNRVIATNFEGAAISDFELPGNVTDLFSLGGLATFPFDTMSDTWGVAMLAVQADLPDTLPGQNVTLVVFGDVSLENEVPPGEIITPQSVVGTSTSNPNLRLGPGKDFAIVGSLSVGEEVNVIGRSVASDWLQLLVEDEVRWVAQQFIEPGGDLNILPVADTDANPALFTKPLQAFRIRSTPRGSECEEVPNDGVVIQAPQDTTVNFLVNGIEMTVGSTALLRPGETEDSLQVATLAGTIGLTSGGVETTVQPGYITNTDAGSAPETAERYEYEEVRSLPLELLPEEVNAPPPEGTEISAFACQYVRNGVWPDIVPADQPIIFTEALGGSSYESAQRARENSVVSLTFDGEAVKRWGISDPYESDSSINAATGQSRGSAVFQDWWYVVPHPEPGQHNVVLTWVTDRTTEYRCAFTVR